MPIRRVMGGYQWGTTGKIYKTREKAIAQGMAITKGKAYKPKAKPKTKAKKK